jgi:mannitol/fructose-specific phosphotransferase system IIA component (Ntr-type)
LKISRLLREDWVLLDLTAQDRDGALGEMAGHLAACGALSAAGPFLGRLRERERMGSTALGASVAVPHCRLEGLTAPVVLLALSRKGVAFEALDGRPVHVFFLLATPPDKPSLNLQALAAVAKLVRGSPGIGKRVLRAPTAREVLAVVNAAEEGADG